MFARCAAHTFALFVPVLTIAMLLVAFMLLYDAIVVNGTDLAPVLVFSSSPSGLLAAYLTALAFAFNARPEFPWSELE